MKQSDSFISLRACFVCLGRFTAFGWLGETINLSCPDQSTIVITNAILGVYYVSCVKGCCPPSPADVDCQVAVSKVLPEHWVRLKSKCDSKTVCTHNFNGNSIDGCKLGDQAKYMQIYYDCLPGESFSTIISNIDIEIEVFALGNH